MDDAGTGSGRGPISFGSLRLQYVTSGDCWRSEAELEPAQWAELLFWSAAALRHGEVEGALERNLPDPVTRSLLEVGRRITTAEQGEKSVLRDREYCYCFDGAEVLEEGPDWGLEGAAGEDFSELDRRRTELKEGLEADRGELEELNEEVERLEGRLKRLDYQRLVLVRRELGELDERRREIESRLEGGGGEGLDPEAIEAAEEIASDVRGWEERQQEISTRIVRLTRQRDQLERYRSRELDELRELTDREREQAGELATRLKEFSERTDRVRDELQEIRRECDERELSQAHELLDTFSGFEIGDLDKALRLFSELENVEQELSRVSNARERMRDKRADLRTLSSYRDLGGYLIGLTVFLGGLSFIIPDPYGRYLLGSAVLTAVFGVLLMVIPAWLARQWTGDALNGLASSPGELGQVESELQQRQTRLIDDLGFLMKVGTAEDLRRRRAGLERMLELLQENREYWSKYNELRDLRREIPLLEEEVEEWFREHLSGSGRRLSELVELVSDWEQTEQRMDEIETEIAALERELEEISDRVEAGLDELEEITGANLLPAMGWRGRWHEFLEAVNGASESELREELDELDAREERLRRETEGRVGERLNRLADELDDRPVVGEDATLEEIEGRRDEVRQRLSRMRERSETQSGRLSELRRTETDLFGRLAETLREWRSAALEPRECVDFERASVVISTERVDSDRFPIARRIVLCTG